MKNVISSKLEASDIVLYGEVAHSRQLKRNLAQILEQKQTVLLMISLITFTAFPNMAMWVIQILSGPICNQKNFAIRLQSIRK